MTFRRQYASLPKPLTSEFSAPSGAVCIQVRIPDALVHLYLMQGMLAKLTDADFWDGPDADRQEIAAAWQKAYTETEWGFCVTPSEAGNQTRVSFWHRWDENLSIGARTIVFDAAQLWGHYMTTTTPSNGDEVGQRVWLPAGDYEGHLLSVRLTTGCKIRLVAQYEADLSQVVILSNTDLSGTTLKNQVTNLSFTLTQAGEYLFSWKVNAAGATGGGFQLPITMTEIWKVSD